MWISTKYKNVLKIFYLYYEKFFLVGPIIKDTPNYSNRGESLFTYTSLYFVTNMKRQGGSYQKFHPTSIFMQIDIRSCARDLLDCSQRLYAHVDRNQIRLIQ